MKNMNIVYMLVIIIILILFFYYLFLLYNKKQKLKNKLIMSNIGEPYLMEDSISPFNIELTGDNYGENGGLSYLKIYTNDKNEQCIHDYYKNELNIEFSDDTYIIFGAGTTMMVAALYYALQQKLGRNISVNTNTEVFYMLHKKLALPLKNIEWINNINTITDLAVIVSPSNPEGIITNPLQVKHEHMLYDVVYDKPLFTGQFKSINTNLYEEFNKNKNIYITNSFSKLGIPGARFGFLLTRDKMIAEYSKEFVETFSVRYPTAGATIGRIGFYRYFNNPSWHLKLHNIIQKRFDIFLNYCEKYNIKTFNKTRYAPYVYTDKSVEWWIQNFNVATRKGSDFNDTDQHSRFNLMLSVDIWDEFIERFANYKL
jgi:aspartate/methionine/tyrosine aminotransferase